MPPPDTKSSLASYLFIVSDSDEDEAPGSRHAGPARFHAAAHNGTTTRTHSPAATAYAAADARERAVAAGAATDQAAAASAAATAMAATASKRFTTARKKGLRRPQ